MRHAAPLLLLALLAACATPTKLDKECLNANWWQVGYRDGVSGYPRTRLADHLDACMRSEAKVDRDEYYTGHADGLRLYCSPDNALQLGLHGVVYHDACPPEKSAAFLERYRQGRELYGRRHRVDSLDAERLNVEHKLAKAESDEERRRLREQLADIDQQSRQERDLLHREEGRLLPAGGR